MKQWDLSEERLWFFEGAMGTMLQKAGLCAGEVPELWNLLHPEKITAVHRGYLEAGCDLLKTNTFGANAQKLAATGRSVEAVIAAAVGCAKEAVAQVGGKPRYVTLSIGPTGKLLKPLGDLGFEEAYALFSQMARAGEAAGADAVLLETMSDAYELKAAALAVKENTKLPLLATVMMDRRGKMLTGGDIDGTVALLEGLGAQAIGFNCGLGPEQVGELLPRLLARASVPVIVNPNAGMPKVIDGKTCYEVGPEEFAAQMKRLAAQGAHILGGCCGTTPEHLSAMIEACKDVAPQAITPKNLTVISSYGRAVTIDGDPVLIGERINPTGKPRFKQALREGDIDYVLQAAVTQQEQGAAVLDVNVGLPGIDESAAMERAVREIQGVTDLPLVIDTSSPEVMAQALRIYNGKPLLNSVNGKQESMEAVFPLAKRYGAAVVALTLDEQGIPETVEARLAIAKRIVETAKTYGVAKNDLVFDALTLPVSASPTAAKITAETVRRLKNELGVRTVLGVSNVSFGLPQRGAINAAFLTLAMNAGLDAAIVNPGSNELMQAWRSYRVLAGLDEKCADYVAACSALPKEEKTAAAGGEETSLSEAIRRGRRERAVKAAREALQTVPPLELIDREMIPALNETGAGFEAGTIFLPQLLMSAEAAKGAFEVIREAMAAQGGTEEKKHKVVLATVKDDVHDIGKNIVRVLLENYGFEVIDLGKDVPAETVVDAAKQEDVRLVGLSALMTTTVSSMEKTIQALRKETPECKVVVGGAVLTEEYAGSIGADAYGKDAMATVHYAQKVYGEQEAESEKTPE